MTMRDQSPSGGPDLSLRDPRSTVYVQSDADGDNNTREGFRFQIVTSQGKNQVQIQSRRLSGNTQRAWNAAKLLTGANSVEIGPNLTISATGRFIHTNDAAEPNEKPDSLIPEVPFNPDGSAFLEIPFLDVMRIKSAFPGPAVSQIINTTISQVYTPTTDEVVESALHQTGTTPATTDVQYSIYAGPTNSAPLIFQLNFPASTFAASQPAVIGFGLSVRFHRNLTHLIELTSVNSFSLETNASGDVLTDFDLHDFKTIRGITENRMVNKNLLPMVNKNLTPIYAKQF